MNVLVLSDNPEGIVPAIVAAGDTPHLKDGTTWTADIDTIINDGQSVAESIRRRVRVIDL